METINLLRLKNGDDIVSYVIQYSKDQVILREPMLVLVKNDYKSGQQTLGMESWLPFKIIKNNEVMIKSDDVLFSISVSDEFSEFYENMVDNFKNLNETKELVEEERLTEEEMMIILKAVENTEGVIH